MRFQGTLLSAGETQSSKTVPEHKELTFKCERQHVNNQVHEGTAVSIYLYIYGSVQYVCIYICISIHLFYMCLVIYMLSLTFKHDLFVFRNCFCQYNTHVSVHAYVCMHMCIHICKDVYIHIHIFIHMHVYAHIYIYTCLCVCTHTQSEWKGSRSLEDGMLCARHCMQAGIARLQSTQRE